MAAYLGGPYNSGRLVALDVSGTDPAMVASVPFYPQYSNDLRADGRYLYVAGHEDNDVNANGLEIVEMVYPERAARRTR